MTSTGCESETERGTSPAEDEASFRLLARQPLSMVLDVAEPLRIRLRGQECVLFLGPSESGADMQRSSGGCDVALDFCTESSADLFAATHFGLQLLHDFFAALALVTGAPIGQVEPVHLRRLDVDDSSAYAFVRYFGVPHNHWPRPVVNEALSDVQALTLHWDGLSRGERIRRAAHHYARALADDDDLDAFQSAYMGLEAMESPLAEAQGIAPGSEETSGTCESCGHVYTGRRTVLAGVRAYVRGGIHPESASPERADEWKQVSRLRVDLLHGLKDVGVLEERVRPILPAAMHYLHDAICCQSHAHALEKPEYKLARGIRRLVLVGTLTAPMRHALSEEAPLLGGTPIKWVEHTPGNFVPEMRLQNDGYGELGGHWYWLSGALRSVDDDALDPVRLESD